MAYADKLLNINGIDIPDAVTNQAKRCLQDIIATAAAGMHLPIVSKAQHFVQSLFGSGSSPLWFSRKSSSTVGAAFCNAFSVDSLDWHDGFRLTKGHAGATVIPAILSFCAEKPVGGKELLIAIIIGYEVACRAGIALHQIYEPAYHASGSWASLGAAAAVARILQIPADQFDAVLGTAEYYSPMSPMLRCTHYPAAVKDGAAAGAWAAAMAIEMYRHGIEGLPSLLSHEKAGREQMGTFGNDWMILRQYFKPYPTCRWTQPAVEALMKLQTENNFSYTEVESILIETFAEAATLDKFPPLNSNEAQYNMKWAVAVAAVDRQLGLHQIHPDRLSDPRVIELGNRIQFRISEAIQRRFPRECLSIISVKLVNGTLLNSPVTGARGDYDSPLSQDEVDKKFADAIDRLSGENQRRNLKKLIDNLEMHDSSELLKYLL